MQKSAGDENGVQLSIDFDAHRAAEEPEVVSTPADKPPLKDSVMRLYTDGMSVDDISKRLKLPIAQVQFIVDFYLRAWHK